MAFCGQNLVSFMFTVDAGELMLPAHLRNWAFTTHVCGSGWDVFSVFKGHLLMGTVALWLNK